MAGREAVQELCEFPGGPGQLDPAELSELGAEVNLMIIDYFAEAAQPRDDDRPEPAAPCAGDRARPAVADDKLSPVQQLVEQIGVEEGLARAGRPD